MATLGGVGGGAPLAAVADAGGEGASSTSQSAERAAVQAISSQCHPAAGWCGALPSQPCLNQQPYLPRQETHSREGRPTARNHGVQPENAGSAKPAIPPGQAAHLAAGAPAGVGHPLPRDWSNTIPHPGTPSSQVSHTLDTETLALGHHNLRKVRPGAGTRMCRPRGARPSHASGHPAEPRRRPTVPVSRPTPSPTSFRGAHAVRASGLCHRPPGAGCPRT